ncbi:MAG: EAL domain-containing protein, partial [Roseomonas sp.]|nr:EAL domain-containing protein [Roseomonas sp.]
MSATPGDRLEADLIEDALLTAGIGTWSVDLATQSVRWSAVTRAIHEVPQDYRPSLKEALGFFAPQARPRIAAAIAEGTAGTPWDLDLELVTGHGRHIWVRTSGRTLHAQGQPTHLVGTIADITQRRAQSEESSRLALIVQQMHNAAIITGPDFRIRWANEGFRRLTGYGLDDARGRRPDDLLHGPGTDPAAARAIADAVRAGQRLVIEILKYHREGREIWVSCDIAPMRRRDGTLRGFIAIETDISALKREKAAGQAEIARRTTAETLLREVMDASPIAVIAYDQNDRLIFFNSTYHGMFPRMRDGMRLGTTLEEVIRHGLAHGQYPDAGDTPASQEAWLTQYLAAHRQPGPSRQLMLPDGRWLQLRERRSPSGYLVCTRTDITRLKVAEEEAKRLSELDPLTRLGNRALLFRRLAGLVAGGRHGDAATACLLIFDLDHFKATNDTLGHPAGDALLQEIAARGLQMLRREDSFVRLGGDEFAILLPGITTAAQALSFLGQLRVRMEAPLAYGTATITPSLSIGVALFPSDASDTDALFRSADTALYHAKRLGRHCHSFFDRSIAAALERKAELADQLRRAIAGDELSVALQPQMRVRDGAHLGFEALARWSENAAPVPPSEFIPVAEEMGLIAPLGALVLDQALGALRHLLHLGLEPGRVAVNVATAQLLSDDFPRQVRDALARHGVPAHRLELELTETTLLDRSAERIVHVLRELKRMGVSIALDDFGTGYASLSHLTQFHVDRLKIDRRFVRDIGEGGAPSPIARTIIGLAHGLGLEVVAEGVENAAQLQY